MGRNLKQKKPDKISQGGEKKKKECRTLCSQCPALSLKRMTTNKKYSLNPIYSDKNCVAAFLKLCETLTKTSYSVLFNKDKTKGFESFEYQRLSFNATGEKIPKDQKVYVIRFDKQKKRVIGYKDDYCSVFYIIGIDYDHSAYNHGK